MPHEGEFGGKISVAKANRKIAKPIMEKKRRARINASLNELKSLLVEVLQKEGCRHSSKMEKADILEMAVRHLKNLQKQQSYSGTPMHTLRDSYPPAIPLEKYASSLPVDCLSPDMGRFLGQNSTDCRTKNHPASPDSSITGKLDCKRNILPAPQPINLNSLATVNGMQSMVTKTANGEIAVVLPQHLLKQAGTNNSGLVLPIYTLPSQQSGESFKPQQPVMISINMPLQQSPNSAFSQTSSTSSVTSSVSSPSPVNYQQPPVSPVWRPW